MPRFPEPESKSQESWLVLAMDSGRSRCSDLATAPHALRRIILKQDNIERESAIQKIIEGIMLSLIRKKVVEKGEDRAILSLENDRADASGQRSMRNNAKIGSALGLAICRLVFDMSLEPALLSP